MELLAEAANRLAQAEVPRDIADGAASTRMTATRKPGRGVMWCARHCNTQHVSSARLSLAGCWRQFSTKLQDLTSSLFAPENHP